MEIKVKYTEKIKIFIKKETVLCIAVILACISTFFVFPDKKYSGYIDYRVIVLLFALMTIMEGFKSTGLFEKIAVLFLKKVSNFRQLLIVLILICFFSSMLITNDVALITFVPFTIMVLHMADLYKEIMPVIIMETVSANLGSMATPVGNPQNLYIYSVSSMNIYDFLKIMAPVSVLALIIIILFCFIHKNYRIEVCISEKTDISADKRNRNNIENALLGILFVLSLLSVFRIMSWKILLIVILVGSLIIKGLCKEKYLPFKADFALLFTFAAFFVFIGNVGRIEAVTEVLKKIINGREMILSFGCSQVISNVPAAILLSGFTDNFSELLLGVNIGGLGTLIASLASLISYKFFIQEHQKEYDKHMEIGTKGRYILWFTIVNISIAAILLVITYMCL